MSDLSFIEQTILEEVFRMGDGYVLDFSNNSFQGFIGRTSGIDIYAAKYEFKGSSKANRLRAFWEVESNYLVSQVIKNLIQHVERRGLLPLDFSLMDKSHAIVERLESGNPAAVELPEQLDKEDRTHKFLVHTIQDSLNRDQPELVLDRLHTFVTRFMKDICSSHGIETNKEKPLHSMMGEYVKFLDQQGALQSEITKRILKSSISILESFNTVRNEQSLAHDNNLLGYDESRLIVSHIGNAAIFIQSVEKNLNSSNLRSADEEEFDIPF